MRRSVSVAAAMVAVGLLAAACSSSPAKKAAGTKTPQGTVASVIARTTTTTTVPVTAATTTTAAVTPSCTKVSGLVGQPQGAAGTIVGTITLTAVVSTPCTLVGYPTLVRYGAGGAVVPVHVVNGLTINLSGAATQPPALVTLSATQQAEFTFQYSDVPTGSETTCAASSTLSVATPGQTTGSAPFALAMSPCSAGTIEVSPFYVATAGG